MEYFHILRCSGAFIMCIWKAAHKTHGHFKICCIMINKNTHSIWTFIPSSIMIMVEGFPLSCLRGGKKQ